jgi:hypothetical protein
MDTRRVFDFLHALVAITFPLWSVVLWIDIHIRLLLGIFLIFDPTSHQLTKAVEHACVYGILFSFLGLYERSGSRIAPTALRAPTAR